MNLNKIELSFNKKIQKSLNLKNTSLVFSKPFNTISFIVLILILFYYKCLNTKEIIIILLSSIFIVYLKIKFKRVRPYLFSNNILNHTNKKHNVSKFDEYSFPSGHSFHSLLLFYFYIKDLNPKLFFISHY